jgi:GT2 family glycosyltransferase
MDRVAVNIVTWNSADYITTCLDHLAKQTHTALTITIVDNASTDDTVARIQAWGALPLSLIQNDHNRGFAPAHNQAIARTRAPFVLVLNPDVTLQPDFIAHMVAAIRTDERIGSVSGKLIQMDPAAADTPPTPHLIDSAGLHMKRSRRQALNGYQQTAHDHFTTPQVIFGPDGAAPLYRRTMLEDIALEGEYFDELFITHKEDVDLAWRAQLRGWQSRLAPQAIAYHVRGFRPGGFLTTRRQMDPRIRVDAVKNRWLMLIKNDLPGPFLRHLPYILPYELAMLGYMLLLEQRSLAAIPKVLRLLPQALHRRRLTQGRRRASPQDMRSLFVN